MSTSLLKIEQDLQAQLEAITAKLNQVRSVTPTLTTLEESLDAAFAKVSELDMLPTLLELLSSKTQAWGISPVIAPVTTTIADSPLSSPTIAIDAPNAPATAPVTATASQVELAGERGIRARAKAFVNFTGKRFTNVACKNLLVQGLEPEDQALLDSRLNTEDANFWTVVDEIIDEIETANHELEAYDSIMPQFPMIEPVIEPAKKSNSNEISNELARQIVEPTIPTIVEVEPALESTNEALPSSSDHITEEQAQKGAVVKNEVNGQIGTIEITGFTKSSDDKDTVIVRYTTGIFGTDHKLLSLLSSPQTVVQGVPTALLPDTQAIALPAKPAFKAVESVEQTTVLVEVEAVEPVETAPTLELTGEEFSPADLAMIAELEKMGNTMAELTEMMLDAEILEIIRESKPNATQVSISNLYEWMTCKDAITDESLVKTATDEDVDF